MAHACDERAVGGRWRKRGLEEHDVVSAPQEEQVEAIELEARERARPAAARALTREAHARPELPHPQHDVRRDLHSINLQLVSYTIYFIVRGIHLMFRATRTSATRGLNICTVTTVMNNNPS